MPAVTPRILLVEDNDQNAYLARFLLEKTGLAVEHAKSGAAAFEVLETLIPDLILLDIQLPDIDGYEIARKLKANSKYKHIPILALSSFAMTGEKKKALDAGCDGYVEKPIEPMKFASQVRRFLGLETE